MKRLALATFALLGGAAVLFALGLRAPEPLPAPERGLRLPRVDLVVPGGPRLRGVSVEIEGSRIARIGPGDPDARGETVDATVLPGFTDMHVHFPQADFPGDRQNSALLFLLHGVTTVRVMGGTDLATRDLWREETESGLRVSPRLFACGPFLDGREPLLPGARSLPGPDEAREAVRELAAAGADCLKAYDRLETETVVALREEAQRHGIPVVGHTPQETALEVARVQDVQHLRGVHPPFLPDEGRHYPELLFPWLRMDDARRAEVIAISRRHGMAYTPTLSAIEATLRARDWEGFRASPAVRLWPAHLRDGLWSAEVGLNPVRFMVPRQFKGVATAVQEMQKTILALHEAGIPLHTGTDANAPNVIPGESLHREFRLLHEAGLTAEEVLRLSTVASPRYLGLSDAGRLEPGAPADLVVFRGDPTRDLRELDGLLGVVRDGRWLPRDELVRRLERLQAREQGFAYRAVVLPTVRGGMRALTAVLEATRAP